jgi:hypothetical protein
MLPKKYYTYYNDTYGATTYLYVGTSEEFCEWLKTKFECVDEPVNGSYMGLSLVLTTANGCTYYLIWIPKCDFTIEDYVTLSHETLHTALRIMQRRGCENIGQGASEELAYLHDAIYRAFLRRLLKGYNDDEKG